MSGNKKSIQDDAEMQKFIEPLYKLDEVLSQQAAMDAGKPQLAVSKEPLPPAPPIMGRPLMVYLDAGGNSKFNHYYNSNCNQQNNSINPQLPNPYILGMLHKSTVMHPLSGRIQEPLSK